MIMNILFSIADLQLATGRGWGGGGARNTIIYAGAFGGHLFYDLFSTRSILVYKI